jgi:hypothetical protein
MLINFTKLWQCLPLEEYSGWIKTDWDNRREILHLLCGALWHLELASHMKSGDFSEDNIAVLLNPGHSRLAPWEHWTSRFPVPPEVTVQTEERALTMRYTFCTSLPPHLPVLLQTLLLADGALRLAGAYELLPTSKLTRLGDDVSFKDILKDDGSFKNSLGLYDPRVCLLLVIAFRDSFMHGENPPEKKPRFTFRRKWFAGDFASTNPKLPYSPAIIAQACQKVWEEISSLMT